MTYHIFSSEYPYGQEYYYPSYGRAYSNYQRRRQMELKEERKRQFLQQRSLEIQRRQRIEEERKRKLKQASLERQLRERRANTQGPLIVQGHDGSLYAIYPRDQEDKVEQQPIKRSNYGESVKRSLDHHLNCTKRIPIEERVNDTNVAANNDKIKLADVVDNTKKKCDINIQGSVIVEDASDDESEESSDYSHLLPEEGDSWMQPIEK